MEIKKIELKKIQVFEAMSEETNCYVGTVYINGKPAIEVKNDGHGGGDMQYPINGNDRRILDAANEYCKKNFPASLFLKPFEEATAKDVTYCDLECWCGDQVTDYLIAKDVASMTKTKVAFLRGKDTFTIKKAGHTVEKITAHLQKTEGKDVFIFNNVSKEEAVKKMKELHGFNPHSRTLTAEQLKEIEGRDAACLKAADASEVVI